MVFVADASKLVGLRIARPSHEPWTPWAYQERAVQFLMERGAAALFLDPGLGKTSIVLEAFRRLKERGAAERMLVVAPKRVCELVWEQEGRKWSQFRDLSFSFLHGPKKAERLRDDVDIHLINPEGVPWLIGHLSRAELRWDTVVIDELTKFKNHRAQRSKLLRRKLGTAQRRWGLTGSPAPNGYMDLFGQLLILDDGAALGQYVTYFRDRYFQKGFTGFDWSLTPGSAERIEDRISPYVLRMAAEDYLDLPPLQNNTIEVRPPPDAMKQYQELKRDMLLTVPEGTITAANAGGVFSKLKQLANGAIYLIDDLPGGKREFVELHSAKLDALEDLIEELAGQPLLVAYEFQHDLTRILGRLGKDTPSLAGVSGARAAEIEAAWNRGELPVLLVHPASAGHGLNLQGAGASHICWFSKPWDLEQYEQTIRRILRQGSTADRVVCHALVVRGTVDDLVEEALTAKDTTQKKLLAALGAEVMREDPAPIATGSVARTEDNDMTVKKLGFRRPGSGGVEAGAAAPAPKGWGAPATGIAEDEDMPPIVSAYADSLSDEDSATPTIPKGWGAPPSAADDGAQQREQIRGKLRAPEPAPEQEQDEASPAQRALEAFPPGVVEALTGGEEEGDAPVADSVAATTAPIAEGAWDGVSTRYVNVLTAAGLASAQQAYEQGREYLLANVPGFGEKGWEELSSLGGAEPVAAEAPKRLGVRVGTGVQPAPRFVSEEAERAHHAASTRGPVGTAVVPAPDAEAAPVVAAAESAPTAQFHFSYHGVPADVVAAFCEALSSSLRNLR